MVIKRARIRVGNALLPEWLSGKIFGYFYYFLLQGGGERTFRADKYLVSIKVDEEKVCIEIHEPYKGLTCMTIKEAIEFFTEFANDMRDMKMGLFSVCQHELCFNGIPLKEEEKVFLEEYFYAGLKRKGLSVCKTRSYFIWQDSGREFVILKNNNTTVYPYVGALVYLFLIR